MYGWRRYFELLVCPSCLEAIAAADKKVNEQTAAAEAAKQAKEKAEVCLPSALWVQSWAQST